MRLALNGWPPLASHVAALLIGGAVAGFMHPPEGKSPRLPPRAIIVTLPDELTRTSSPKSDFDTKEASQRPAALVFVRAGRNGQASCRMGPGSWRPFGRKPTALIGTHAQAREFASIAALLRKRELTLVEESAAAALAACNFSPKVVYDAP